MKQIIIAILLLPITAFGQIWPTDVQYQFLNGIYGGMYGNLHITSDGDIDTIKGSAYDWPDSLRVVNPGSRYYLTGTYSGGQYDLDWRRPSKADVSDLTENQVLYGGANGEIAQTSNLVFTDDGATSILTTEGVDNAEINITSTSVSDLRINVSPLDFRLANSGVSFFFIDQTSNKSPFCYNGGNFRIGINTVGPEVDLHIIADTIRFEGLDGTGDMLQISTDGDITRTQITAGQDITITNGSGAITIANTYNLDAGTYTPTIQSVANIDATVSAQCQYMRVGSVVTVSGVIQVDPTATGLTEFRINLPITSDITAVNNLGGVATVTAASTRYTYQIQGDVTNNAAYFSGYTTYTANNQTSFTFTYLIQ